MNMVEMGKDSIITSDEIRLILDDYCIGKKPLARLLGWGETTIIRYIEGDIPTFEYSNKLRNILDDPSFYYDLLLSRQEYLTGVAFRKSKKATISKLMTSKIYAVVYYIINKSNGEVSAYYMQFLLYYIQAFSLALNNKEMFPEDYNVNMEGIPYRRVYDNMKKYTLNKLEMDGEFLTKEEKELIDSVYYSFTWYGPRALKTLFDYEKQLLKPKSDLLGSKIISKEAMKSYFQLILNTYNISETSEIDRYPVQCIMELRDLNLA